MEEGTVQLGGNIELTGFHELDGGMMVILKKIVGNYARKMSDKCTQFEKLSITMKKIGTDQHELHAKLLDNGQTKTSEITERNVFVGIDMCLKKIMNQLDH